MINYLHPKVYPSYNHPYARPPVDLYLQGRYEDDTAFAIVNDGITKPIYDLNGNISRQLPLEDWPPENDYHKEVYLMQRRIAEGRCVTCKAAYHQGYNIGR